MPYIKVSLTADVDKNAKNALQEKLTEALSSSFSKPKTYIMAEIEDNCSLYMAGNPLEFGAYISIKSLGAIQKASCASFTKIACDILKQDFGIEGNNVYITYHPVEYWGFNGSMF